MQLSPEGQCRRFVYIAEGAEGSGVFGKYGNRGLVVYQCSRTWPVLIFKFTVRWASGGGGGDFGRYWTCTSYTMERRIGSIEMLLGCFHGSIFAALPESNLIRTASRERGPGDWR